MPQLSDLQADWPALNLLLDEALDLPPAQRAAWLDALPVQSPSLKAALEQLLEHPAAVSTGDFLQTLPKLGDAQQPVVAPGGHLLPAAGGEVGPWRLLREVGEGGMGSVWLAERSDGQLKRQVALKLPRLTWSRGLAERMARERDILATLEHPHIARLYDAGVDAHGRPWLALEHVQGRPIDVHCNEHGLDVCQRVQLLLQVCEAVAYAHSRLVIHRDLKPSNILVTDEGQVQLLDFGIATLLQSGHGGAAEGAPLTALHGRALTLDYASPEQVRGEPLGTASDVYSLGVVAFELLAGSRPYRLQRGSQAELEQAITDADIPRASVLAPAERRRLLRGDIDAVLNKALKKQVAERYAGVADLAADLRRYLRDEPVTAQPDTLAYRAAKLLRRHRLQAVAAGSVALALLVGTALALTQARRADAERALALQAQGQARQAQGDAERQAAIAQAQRARAEEASARSEAAAAHALAESRRAQQAVLAEQRAAAEARERSAVATAVQGFMTALFEANSARQPDPQKARTTTARELLDIGAERIAADLQRQPAVRSEAALLLSRLYSELGLDQKSLDMANMALEAARQSPQRGVKAEVAAMAQVLEQTRVVGKVADIAALREQVEGLLRRQLAAGGPDAVLLLRKLALLDEMDRPDRAWTLAARAGAMARRAGDDAQLAQSLSLQARAAVRLERNAEAEALLQASLQAAARAGTTSSFELAQTRAALAEAQSRLLRFGTARQTLQAALAAAEREGGPEHIDVQQLRMRMSTPLKEIGEWAQAADLLEQAEAVLRRQGAQRHLALSLLLSDLGLVRTELGRLQAADDAFAEAVRLRDALRPGSDAAAALRENLAVLRMAQGRPDDAERALDASERIRTALGQRRGHLGWDRLARHRVALARERRDLAAAGHWAALHSGAAAIEGATPTLGRLLWLVHAAALALDSGELNEAAGHLHELERWLAPLRAGSPLVAMEVAYRTQCARLALLADAPAGAADQQAGAAVRLLGPAVLEEAPARRALQQVRVQMQQRVVPQALSGVSPAPRLCPAPPEPGVALLRAPVSVAPPSLEPPTAAATATAGQRAGQ